MAKFIQNLSNPKEGKLLRSLLGKKSIAQLRAALKEMGITSVEIGGKAVSINRMTQTELRDLLKLASKSKTAIPGIPAAAQGGRVVKGGVKGAAKAAAKGITEKAAKGGIGKFLLGGKGAVLGGALSVLFLGSTLAKRNKDTRLAERLDQVPGSSAESILRSMQQKERLAMREARLMQQDPEAYESLRNIAGGQGLTETLARGEFTVGGSPTPSRVLQSSEVQDILAALTAG